MSSMASILRPAALTRQRLSSSTTANLLGYVALLALAALPYLNALRCDFTFDDEVQLTSNPSVMRGIDVLRTFASPLYPGDLYRPLTILTFAVNETLSPGNTAAYHAVNILLHVTVVFLVMQLAQLLFGSRRIAWLVGALFAVHPLHTEAVTSLVGRAEELAALFTLVAMLTATHLDAATDPWERRAWHGASVIAFVLAFLSKESGLTALPLIMLLRVVQRREPLWRGLRREIGSADWVPYALCAALFVWLRSYVTTGVSSADALAPLDNILAFVPTTMRIRSALGIFWDYFGLLNVPIILVADYSHSQVPVVPSWLDLRCLAGLFLVLVSVLVFLRYRQPALAFAAIFPLVTLSLTCNVLFPIGTAKAERLVYLPSVGWVLLLGYFFERALRSARHRRLAAACFMLLISLYGARTWWRNRDWLDDDSLYRSMVVGAPQNAKARYNYAILLLKEGRNGDAMMQFQKALKYYPWAEGAALGVGFVLEKSGQVDRAAAWYRHALDMAPGFTKAHTNLCRLLLDADRFAGAAVACRRGLLYDPLDPNLLKGLGASLIGTGEREKGILVLRKSLELNHSDESLRVDLARLEANTAAAASISQ